MSVAKNRKRWSPDRRLKQTLQDRRSLGQICRAGIPACRPKFPRQAGALGLQLLSNLNRILSTASCATRTSVSSFLYGNGESDLWRRLFLGSGRNFSQIKRRDRYRGRLRWWRKGESVVRGRLHGRNRPCRSRAGGI